jgi:hypothetical protein
VFLKKNTLKYPIDAALFVDISSMAVLGFLLAFVIPRGRGHGFSEYFLGWSEVRRLRDGVRVM